MGKVKGKSSGSFAPALALKSKSSKKIKNKFMKNPEGQTGQQNKKRTQDKPAFKTKIKKKHKWKDSREKKKLKQFALKADCPTSTQNDNLQQNSAETTSDKNLSLRERMLKRLEAARFRQINESLDSGTNESHPDEVFSSDPELFKKYHEAYKKQVQTWLQNPLDLIIKWIKKKIPKDKIIADFGCGEARLSESVRNKVHSFDLFALNERVVPCDMSKVPLDNNSVDVAVFCLSLMGTDVGKYVSEANRVLRAGGILKIAEVRSRFGDRTGEQFIKRLKRYGFVIKQDGGESFNSFNSDMFVLWDFVKKRPINSKSKLPPVPLKPSVYKKR